MLLQAILPYIMSQGRFTGLVSAFRNSEMLHLDTYCATHQRLAYR